MTARRDLAVATEGAERVLDGIWTPMARMVPLLDFRRLAGRTMTQEVRAAMLAQVDALLDAAYGRRHGELTPVWLTVARWANAVALAPVDAAVADVRTRLKDEPELLARMERGANP